MAYEEIYTKPASGIPKTDLNASVQASLDLADSALQSVPDLSASKITSGTFADERIASASVWNAKQDAIAPNTYDTYGSASAVQGNLNTHTADASVHVTSAEKSAWNGKVESLSDLGVTATAAELNVLDGITASTTELNYVDGVTSNIQTQFDGKQNTLTFDSAPTSGSTNPVTSGGVYTAVDAKYTKPSGGIPDSDIASASTWNAKASVSDITTKINRSTNVNVADTNYTTLMARGESLNSSDTTPSVNGAICWTYS